MSYRIALIEVKRMMIQHCNVISITMRRHMIQSFSSIKKLCVSNLLLHHVATMEETTSAVWSGKTNLGLLAILFALALSGLHLIYRDSMKNARSAPSASKIPFGRPLSVTHYNYSTASQCLLKCFVRTLAGRTFASLNSTLIEFQGLIW